MAVLPGTVLTFLCERIDSIEQLETLLLLQKNASKEWTAEEVSRTLFTTPESASSRLAEFHANGLVRFNSTAEAPRYQYAPKLRALEKTIADLAEAYAKYPVRVIDIIFSKPLNKIRTFTDESAR
jgi:hypothetical protein